MSSKARIALYCLLAVLFVFALISQITRPDGSRFAETILGWSLGFLLAFLMYLSVPVLLTRMLAKVRRRDTSGVQILVAADERIWQGYAAGLIPQVRYGVIDVTPDGLRFIAGINHPKVIVFIAADLVERITVSTGKLGLRKIRSLEITLSPGTSAAPLICFPIRPTLVSEKPSILQQKILEAQRVLEAPAVQ